MHHIQAKILQKLIYAEALGYAALRPTGVESNHFAYHLERLLRVGLIKKADKSYILTPAGLALIDTMSQEKVHRREQPIIAQAIEITNNFGETLLYQRKFQPFIHAWGFPLGKMHLGESLHEAARRELFEKTGLVDIPLTLRGFAYVAAKQDNVVITQILMQVFHGKVEDRPETTQNHRGYCLWADPSSVEGDFMPGFWQIKKALHRKELFVIEVEDSERQGVTG